MHGGMVSFPVAVSKITAGVAGVKHESLLSGSEWGVRIIIEFDGPVFDPAPLCYAAHQAAATDVGWSRLDQATFRRLMRTKGKQADFLPGAKPAKIAEYDRRFAEHVESDALLAAYGPQPEVRETLAQLARVASCSLMTAWSNLDGRRVALEKHGLAGFAERLEAVESDPRRRPAQLRRLGEGDPRTLVAAATDSLIRSAVEAELFTVGIASGGCSVARLHQAGANVVYKELHELATSLRSGAADLIGAGLLPPSLDPPR
jgi:phosphoglycolate phosphatase-like HAD superfamily hydrolase